MLWSSKDDLLDVPGAGLPPAELHLILALFKLYSLLLSKKGVLAHFSLEADRVKHLASSVDDESARIRILINRVPGIEDNSRYWSVYMVLEHLSIVNNGIMRIIETLVQEKEFLEPVRIEDVKPHASANARQLTAFSQSVRSYLVLINRISDLRSTTCHPHPWFGPLNAHEWHCLAAVHQTVHRHQISRILATLG